MGDEDMLTYTDGTRKIVSSYIYKGNDLYVLKDGVNPVYVATKEEDGSGFYRRMLMCGYISEGKIIVEGKETDGSIMKADTVNGAVYDLSDALKYADFNSPESFTNPKDTIVWCNVKYIYN